MFQFETNKVADNFASKVHKPLVSQHLLTGHDFSLILLPIIKYVCSEFSIKKHSRLLLSITYTSENGLLSFMIPELKSNLKKELW